MIWLLPFIVLASVLQAQQVRAFSLYDVQKSYAKFERWPANGSANRVSLRFKTNTDNGLLLYVDDDEANQFLIFYIHDGFLVLQFHDGTRQFKVTSGMSVNDLQWREILVKFTSHHVAFKIDSRTLAEYTTNDFSFKSHVYIGGFPIFMAFDSLAFHEAAYMRRYLGCIEGLRYGNDSNTTHAAIVQSVGLGEQCVDACRPQNPCKNHGVCINRFAMAECVCTGTGFTGSNCTQELPVVGVVTSDDGVIIDVMSTAVSNPDASSLIIRFRSSQANGAFFYIAEKGDFILLELSNGNIATSVNLGSGSVTMATNGAKYDDNRWHVVRLQRYGRNVNFTVDNNMTVQGETKGKFTAFGTARSKASIRLGALTDDELKQRSVSGRNFVGCVQELHFNDYDLFSKLDDDMSDVRARDTITRVCPDVSKATTSVTPPSSSTPDQTTPATTPTNAPISSDTLLTSTHSRVTPNSTTPTSTLPTYHSCPSGSCSTTRSRPTLHSKTPTSTTNTPTSVENDPTTFAPTDHTTSTPPKSENIPTTVPKGVGRSAGSSSTGRDTRLYTDEVIMVEKNEREAGERDLTLWFVLAAAIAIMAFILAVGIIIKVHATNRKRYHIKESTTALNDSSGTFQRNRQSESLV